MYRIRYDNGQMLHPDLFIGCGWRGLFIRALNWARWKLETYVQLQVLRLQLRSNQVPKDLQRLAEKRFSAATREEVAAKVLTSPVQIIPVEPAAQAVLQSTILPDAPLPPRGDPIEGLIARHMPERASRYAKGRRGALEVPEENFEPVIREKVESDNGKL